MGKETADHTFNPWWGCTKISPGCDHCYAETLDRRWYPYLVQVDGKPITEAQHWGKGKPRRQFRDKHWNEPIAWNTKAAMDGRHAMVFCASMADVMDDEAPEGERDRLWELIDRTPNLIWQLLTKRPQRYQRYLPAQFKHDNVWLGTTAEDQENYDLRWPLLYEAARSRELKTFISYEPAIGPLTMKALRNHRGTYFFPDWLILGGESGPGRRPMNESWFVRLINQCSVTGTRPFVKQFSAATPKEGKLLVPEFLRIHQFPKN